MFDSTFRFSPPFQGEVKDSIPFTIVPAGATEHLRDDLFTASVLSYCLSFILPFQGSWKRLFLFIC
jgi:hypothetical protein